MADGKHKPHLILILADQLRFDMLGAYGDQQTPTPKLDLLAQRSTVFQRHFTPCPLCVPARSSLMTGLPPHRHGAYINGWFDAEEPYGTVRDGLPLLPQRLADAGYRVVHAGVQHVRTKPTFVDRQPDVEFLEPMSSGAWRKGLDQRGLMYGDMNALKAPVVDWCESQSVVTRASTARTATFPLREDLFFDCMLTDRICGSIKSHRGRTDDRPLALFANLWLPHPPLWAPRQWAELIDPDDVRLPPTVGQWFEGMPAAQLQNIPGQLGANVSMDDWRRAWAMTMGMVALLDQCVGRILATLDKRGMLDDATVVFSSDHGEMLGSHGLYQKMCLYEEAVRVPLLIKMPGQRGSQVVGEPTTHLDLPATLTTLAGAEPLATESDGGGRSLHTLAQTGELDGEQRQYVFASYDGNAGRGFQQRMAPLAHAQAHHPSRRCGRALRPDRRPVRDPKPARP